MLDNICKTFGIHFGIIQQVMTLADELCKEYNEVFGIERNENNIHVIAKEQYNSFQLEYDTITELCLKSYTEALRVMAEYDRMEGVHNLHLDFCTEDGLLYFSITEHESHSERTLVQYRKGSFRTAVEAGLKCCECEEY